VDTVVHVAARTGTPAVNKALRSIAWPALAEHGFTEHTQRSAWRHREHVTDVVNFQSAGVKGGPLYLGAQLGHASLGTFGVNLGTYFDFMRVLPFPRSPWTLPKDPARPDEWTCDCRTTLRRVVYAAASAVREDLWPVNEDGSDAPEAVRDAVTTIRTHGLVWFAGNGALESVFSHYDARCKTALGNPRYQDPFFRDEDILVAAALALGRLEDAIQLYEAVAARSVDPKERAEHERTERRRMRRKPDPRRPLLHVPHPHWHDEACYRLDTLRKLRPQ
jgi:hypothetical protein